MSQAKGAETRKLAPIIQGTSVIALSLKGVARMRTIPMPNSTAWTIMKTIAAICIRVDIVHSSSNSIGPTAVEQWLFRRVD
jgi:hypothetical protein